MLRNILRFTVFACFLTVAGCRASRPVAYIIINNDNAAKTPVNISVSLHGPNTPIGKQILSQAAVQPGLQFIPGKKYKKGTYSLYVSTPDGNLNIHHPLTLDSDRWIIINYTLGDSSNIVRTYGYLDTTSFKKINERYANLDLYIENRRPPNL